MSSVKKHQQTEANSLDRLEELGKIEKDKNEVVRNVRTFLQRNGAYSQLQALVNVFAPTKRKDLTLRVNVGGGSYTDGEVVVVGLFDFMWELEKHEIFSALKALTAHEVGHVLHSDFEAFKEFQEKVADYFFDKYEIDHTISKEVARGVANSIEDGRVERLMGQAFQGIVPNIRFMRTHWWENQAIPTEQDVPQFSVWSACVVTLATTGLWPKGMDIVKYEEAYQETLKVLPWIQAGILSNDPRECLDFCWEIILQCEEFILKEIQQTQDFMDLLNQLMEAQTTQYENGRDDSGDGESQQNGSGQPQEGQGSGTHIDPRLISSDSLKELAKKMKSKPNSQSSLQSNGSSSSLSSSEEETDKKSSTGGSASDDKKDEDTSTDGQSSDSTDGVEDKNSPNKEKSSDSSDGEGDENSSTDGQSSDSNPQSSENLSESNDFNHNLTKQNPHQKFTKDMVKEEDIQPATPEAYASMIEELRKRHEKSAKKDVSVAEKYDQNEENIKNARLEKEKREQAKMEQNLIEIKKQFKNDFGYHKMPFQPQKVRLTNEIIAKGKMLHNHFQTILNQDPEEDFARYKKGSLDTSALWRISTQEKRLFNRREPDVHSCAVSILIDGSGSMACETRYYGERSTRFEDALRAGAIIEEGLRGLVPLSITVFTTGHSEVTHYPLKEFAQQSKVNHCWSFFKHSDGPFWGNADGYSIAIVGDELKKRSEDQKILFVISDGLPAFRDGVEETRKAVRNLKQDGVKVIGIGVGDDALDSQDDFVRMYEKQSVLIETEKITDYLIRYLSKLLA